MSGGAAAESNVTVANYSSIFPNKMSKPLPESKVGQLIKEIHERPVLWDTDSTEYGVKQLTVFAWYQVQEKLGLPEDVLRYKWKNLRDTFRRECRKKKIREGDTYSGPWKHFNSLTFLFSRYPTPPDDDDDEEEDPTTHEYQDSIQPENVLDIKFEEINANGDDDNPFEEDECDHPSAAKRSRYSSRRRSPSAYPDEEYDIMFLQSLTPYFRALDPIKKLALRGKIVDMLTRELAPLHPH